MATGLSPVERLADFVDTRRPGKELRRPSDTERGEGRERHVPLDGESHDADCRVTRHSRLCKKSSVSGKDRALPKPKLVWRIEMNIKRSGSQPSGKGPAEYFTGTVRIDPLFQPNDPARALGASVTFDPRARTPFPTHP